MTLELDQSQIIQEILLCAIAQAEDGWTEMIIDYHVDDSQSDFGNSYLIVENGEPKEKSLPCPHNLDGLMRKLRNHLAQAGRPPFTSCKMHVHSGGKFEATYGYDEVDWDSLVLMDWHFLPKRPRKSNA